MNVGIITTTNHSGHSYLSLNFAKALKDDFNVRILSTLGVKDNAYGASVWKGFVIDLIPCSYLALGSYWDQVKKWIENNKIELIFLNEWYDWELAKKIKELGVKLVCYIDFFQRDWIPLFEMFDATIACAEHTFEVFVHQRNSHFVYWGVDLDLYKPRDGEKCLFFHSAGWGGINDRKCTPQIIKAFYRLWKENKKATLYLHTQKPYFDGATADRIREMRGKGLKVKMGHVPPPSLYHKGLVYVGVSKLEGLGLYIPEALASGLPVITTDKPPMNQFVNKQNGWLIKAVSQRQREDGYFFPEYEIDEEELYQTMKDILENKYDIEEKAKAARKFMEEKHSFKEFKKKVVKIIKGL